MEKKIIIAVGGIYVGTTIAHLHTTVMHMAPIVDHIAIIVENEPKRMSLVEGTVPIVHTPSYIDFHHLPNDPYSVQRQKKYKVRKSKAQRVARRINRK